MKGFELKHNGQITKGTVENGATSISLFQHKGVIHLAFEDLMLIRKLWKGLLSKKRN